MEFISAGLLVFIALVHSLLGESGLIIPLFKEDWEFKEVPRPAAELIFRFAWHLTSIAWIALAGALVGADIFIVVGVQSLVASIVIFFMLRGHLAWPLFLASSAAAFGAAGLLSQSLIYAIALLVAFALSCVAFLHVYWALGGRKGYRIAIPEVEGNTFEPSVFLTFSVAVLLFAMSGSVWVHAHSPSTLSLILSSGIGVVMTIRAIGDFKYAGFMKTRRESDFATYDDLFFTPFVVFIALGTGLTLLPL